MIETEGGHVDFAPLDSLEDRILAHLHSSFRRVSVERLVSGRGLMNIYEALGAIGGLPLSIHDDRSLWAAALDGSDSLAAAALDRFNVCLDAVAGDLALAHGAKAMVIGGGVGLRLADYLPWSGFSSRFIAKGRFERRMAEIPVKLVTHPQPGLFGAAAASPSTILEAWPLNIIGEVRLRPGYSSPRPDWLWRRSVGIRQRIAVPVWLDRRFLVRSWDGRCGIRGGRMLGGRLRRATGHGAGSFGA